MPKRKHTAPEEGADIDFEQKYLGQDTRTLAKSMYQIEVELEELKVQTSALNKEYDFLRKTALPRAAEEEDVSSININFTDDYTGRVGFQTDMYVKMGPKQVAYGWLEDNGHGGLITQTVNAQSLKAAMKERVQKGEGLPPEEVMSVTPFKYATITRVK